MPTSQEPQTLAESLEQYESSLPEAERLDALHQLFYGFYSRIAIVDRTTHELARWARDDLAFIPNLTEPLAEAQPTARSILAIIARETPERSASALVESPWASRALDTAAANALSVIIVDTASKIVPC